MARKPKSATASQADSTWRAAAGPPGGKGEKILTALIRERDKQKAAGRTARAGGLQDRINLAHGTMTNREGRGSPAAATWEEYRPGAATTKADSTFEAYIDSLGAGATAKPKKPKKGKK